MKSASPPADGIGLGRAARDAGELANAAHEKFSYRLGQLPGRVE